MNQIMNATTKLYKTTNKKLHRWTMSWSSLVLSFVHQQGKRELKKKCFEKNKQLLLMANLWSTNFSPKIYKLQSLFIKMHVIS